MVAEVDGVADGELSGGRRHRAKGFSAYEGSQGKLKVGMDSWGEEGVCGEDSGEGEAVVASESTRQWRRPWLPELGETTFSGRVAAHGRSLREREVFCC